MAVFESQEIYQFAMRIEENGERFYRGAAQALQDREAKDLFSHLADEEVRHKRIFESMLSKMESYQMDERYSGEYLEYLRAYIDDKSRFQQEGCGSGTPGGQRCPIGHRVRDSPGDGVDPLLP